MPSSTPTEPVSLRPLRDDDEDFGLMLRWLSDERVLEWVFGRDEGYTLERIRTEWCPATLIAEHVYPQLVELGGRPIGYLQLVWVPPHAKGYAAEGDVEHAWAFDLWIGEPEHWGRGVGTAACVCAIEALLTRGAERIFIDPRVMNDRAVHVYENVGFRKVKVLPANEFHEGAGWDCWLMELELDVFRRGRAQPT
jgi:aminoglycoside 6'-N-acetyltransferase